MKKKDSAIELHPRLDEKPDEMDRSQENLQEQSRKNTKDGKWEDHNKMERPREQGQEHFGRIRKMKGESHG